MKRVILHLGFHKTGSSSVQELLRTNRDLLSPEIHCVVQKDAALRRLEAASKAYDRAPNAVNRYRLRRQWRKLIGRLTALPAETVLISSEDLLGRIPSNRDRSPVYARSAGIVETFQAATPDCALRVAVYTRGGDRWLDSLYRHLVRTRSLGLTFEDFAALDKFAAPDAALRRAAERIGGVANGGSARLSFEDDLRTRLGPGTALLALAGASPQAMARLRPVEQQNAGIGARRVAEIQASAPTWLPKQVRRAVVKLRSR